MSRQGEVLAQLGAVFAVLDVYNRVNVAVVGTPILRRQRELVAFIRSSSWEAPPGLPCKYWARRLKITYVTDTEDTRGIRPNLFLNLTSAYDIHALRQGARERAILADAQRQTAIAHLWALARAAVWVDVAQDVRAYTFSPPEFSCGAGQSLSGAGALESWERKMGVSSRE